MLQARAHCDCIILEMPARRPRRDIDVGLDADAVLLLTLLVGRWILHIAIVRVWIEAPLHDDISLEQLNLSFDMSKFWQYRAHYKLII